ncbi:SWEET sugar transporter [Parasponia andersonii]|uniref:Bidirectional sugar transporter SWEET n=1 Tax=Parasponia andersonii TaxID=3476 RepID=A0A2P5CJ77_PARAD|nr:SWEET sugar transporter [Parasponia andersonii]
MVDTGAIRTVVGIIGNVISFGLFTSPIPTFVKICKLRAVEDFKPDPYVATLLSCALWSFYGLPVVRPDSILVTTINGIGFFIELTYVSIFFVFSSWPNRKKIIIAVVIETIFFLIIVFITLQFLHTTKDRSLIVGLLCIIFNIIMYTSPLTVMRMVIRTKSVKYMPFYLSLANFCNGIVWVIFALLKFDPYVLIPNGLGALSGLVQLILYATYYRTTQWDSDDRKSSSEVQLTDV